MTFPALFPYRIGDISTIFPPVIGCIKCPTEFPVLDRRHASHFSHLTGSITCPTEFPSTRQVACQPLFPLDWLYHMSC